MIRTVIALSISLAAASVHAQTELQTFTSSGTRGETGFFVAQMQNGQFAGAAGAFFVTYGTPTWKDEYASQADSMKGKIARLGKDNWATFDNLAPVAFGNVTVPTGIWYLGIARDNNGAWSLVFCDPAKAKAAGAAPYAPEKLPRTYEVKLTENKDQDDVIEKLTITAEKDGKDQTKGKLTLAWGTFQLTTTFQVKTNTTGDTAAPAPAKKGD
jgi:hypothetical protein